MTAADTQQAGSDLPSQTPDLPSQTPDVRPDASVGRVDAPAEWRHWLTGLTLGLLLFESITGMSIYLLTFSVWNQFGVKSVETLNRLVMLDPAFKEAERHGLTTVIDLESMRRHNAQPEEQPVQIVEGKRVKRWTPKTVSAAGA